MGRLRREDQRLYDATRMRWGRGIASAGIIALMAVPAIALAHKAPRKAPRPAGGAWEPYGSQSDVAVGSFTIASGGVKSMTLDVTDQSGENPGCPTGSLSVPGPLGLTYYKLKGTRPFWGFGKIVKKPAKTFVDATVTATLDGQPVKGAKLSIQFVAADTDGVTGDISGGEFDFSAKCQVSLSEDISQSENAASS